jgi:hypothetical protein
LCAHHRLPEAADPEVEELLRQTDPAVLAKELEKELDPPKKPIESSAPEK